MDVMLPSVATKYALEDGFPQFRVEGKTAPKSELPSLDEAHQLLTDFLSYLTWEQSRPFRLVALEINSGAVPCVSTLDSGGPQVESFVLHWAHDEAQAAALGAYRSALSTTDAFDRLFHLVRCLELTTGSENQGLKAWITATLAKTPALASFEFAGVSARDIASTIVDRIRHRVIHPNATRPRHGAPLNPASLDDIKRVWGVLPTVQALAEHALRDKMGPPSSGSDNPERDGRR